MNEMKEYFIDSSAKLYFDHDEGSDTGDIQFLNGYIMGWVQGLEPDIQSAIIFKNSKGKGLTKDNDPYACTMNDDENEENAVVFFIYDKRYEGYILMMLYELNLIWKKHFSGELKFKQN